MKKKTKIIIIIVSAFIVIWGVFFTTDFIRVKNEKAPVFCIRTSLYKDGGSADYVGLFYWVKRQAGVISDSANSSEANISFTYKIRPWFFTIEFPIDNNETYLNTSNIEYISIIDDNLSEIIITDFNDYEPVSEYSYDGKWPEDKIDELYSFPGSRSFKIYNKNGTVQSYFLLNNGCLVDSDRIRTYSAINSLKKLKVAALLKKYGGYVDKSNLNIFTIEDYEGEVSQALELIAEDENNNYYLSSIRSDWVTVIFNDGDEVSLKFALENNIISIHDVINKGDIGIIIEPKNTTSDKNINSLAKADFNRDGKEETVNVQTKEDYQIIEIVDENGNCLWKDTAGIPHSDWNSFFLCTIEGSAYILQYRPYMIQGSGYYSYKLLYLSEDNKETVYRSNKIEFDINFDQGGHSFDIPAIVAFMNEINGYLAHSELLISTDENLKFDSNTCLQDNLSWLHENTKFQYNESASLSENLRAYEEFEIGQQHE